MAVGSLSACMAEIKANPAKFYCYVLYRPTGEPFYVGVGSGRRLMFHETEAATKARSRKASIIRKIQAAGEYVRYELVGWFDEWNEAAALEKELIARHGRHDIGTGILANRTDGGEGVPNLKWELTEARLAGIERAREKNRGRKLTEEHKAKIGAAGLGRKRSPEAAAKTGLALRGRVYSPEALRNIRDGARRRVIAGNYNVEGLKRFHAENPDANSLAGKERWKDPEYRERMIPALSGWVRDEEYRKKRSAMHTEKHADPEFRAKWLPSLQAALASDEHRKKKSEIGRAKWADPEYRAMMKAARAAKAAAKQ